MVNARTKKTAKPRAGAKRAATKRARSNEEVVVPASLKPVVAAFKGAKGFTVEKGWGSSSVALKARGKIFAMLMSEDLVFKLPAGRVDALVKAHGAKRFDPRRDGRVMKEWIVLPSSLPERVKLAREAFEFVAGGAK